MKRWSATARTSRIYASNSPWLSSRISSGRPVSAFSRKFPGDGGAIKAITLRGRTLSRKDLDDAVDMAKGMGAGGLIWMRRDAEKLQSPVVKFLSEAETTGIDRARGPGTETSKPGTT